MKIAPKSDILIRGVHSPAGVPVEVDTRIARDLVAQGLAVFVADAAPVVETAAAAPAPETAVSRKRK